MKTKKLKEFTVDCSKWVRGGKSVKYGYAKLLNERGNMCCLGFMGEACGIPSNTLSSVGMPQHLDDDVFDTYPLSDRPDLFCEAARINDNNEIADSTRRKKLQKFFKDNFKITVRFINTTK